MTTPPATDPKAGQPPAQPATATGTAGGGAGGTSGEARPAWASDLKDEILGEVRKLVGGAREREGEHLTDPSQSRGARAEQGARNLDQMITDAIAKARDDDAQAAADADLRAKLEAATAEKPPIQRGRFHRFMGWGEPPQ